MPLDSLEIDGLGLDCEDPAMSMICPNELKELKFSVSNLPKGSATLRAMAAINNTQNIAKTRARITCIKICCVDRNQRAKHCFALLA